MIICQSAGRRNKKKKASDDADNTDHASVLPRRLLISAFSNKYGWRLAGNNGRQLKHFTEVFPIEFSEVFMGTQRSKSVRWRRHIFQIIDVNQTNSDCVVRLFCR